MRKACLVFFLTLIIPVCLAAQNSGTGVEPFRSYSSFGFDTVNNQNLNVYFAIPVTSSPGRNLALDLTLTNNSLLWQRVLSGSTYVWTPTVDAAGNPTWGWLKDFPTGGFFEYTESTNIGKCFQGRTWFNSTQTNFSNLTYVDALGTPHGFANFTTTSPDCPNYDSGTSSEYAGDSSGYYMDLVNYSPVTFNITNARGEEDVKGSATAVDANGNYITKTVVSGSEIDYTDSVGNLALKVLYSPNSSNPTQIQYQFLDGTGSGNYKTITLSL